MRTTVAGIVVVAAIIGVVSIGHAQCGLPLTDPVARQRCDAGAAAYRAGDFSAASREFEAAYGIEPASGLLFAWAQAKRQGGLCAEAVPLYRRYLDSKPNESQVKAARRWIEECEQGLAETRPPIAPEPAPRAIEPAPAPLPTRDASPWYRDPLGTTLTIGGVVGLGVGAGFLVAAKRSEDRADAAEYLDDYAASLDEATTRRRIGLVAIGAGAALVAGGVMTYVLHADRRGRDVTVVATGAGLYVRGAF